MLMLVTVTVAGGLAVWSSANLQSSFRSLNRADAFGIAEAGIEYYRWHLAHAPQDFQDGTGQVGPYVHPFYNKDGDRVGTYTLDITPPPSGSTVVKIRSTGTILADPSVKKIIDVRMAIPSLAKYAVVVANDVRFGAGTEIFGPVHSNGGVHFDGVAHNLVSSAQTTYSDPDHSGSQEWAVHTHASSVDPLPPTALPSRPDVFMAGRTVSVPALDFDGMALNLSQIKTDAIAGGFYASSSAALGYDVVFKTNDTFDLYKVTALTAAPQNCTNSAGQSGWGTWSIGAETLIGNRPNPANGRLFLEDNVWVRGQINGARITLGAGRFPDNVATRAAITVNSDLRYTSYDGTDVLGLVAQKDINVGLVSSDTLRIDAALIAENGRAGRYYYDLNCGANYVRSTLTLYGMIASRLRYGFAYTDNTGYITRNLTYDANLLFSPPPAMPLTGDQYTILSWDEVQ